MYSFYKKCIKRECGKRTKEIELENSGFSFSVLIQASGVSLCEEILIKIRFFLTISLMDLIFVFT